MKNKINELIKAYKLDVEGILEIHLQRSHNFELSIELGNNEGYFVNINENMMQYAMRTHSRDEALKILGVMLHLLPNN